MYVKQVILIVASLTLLTASLTMVVVFIKYYVIPFRLSVGFRTASCLITRIEVDSKKCPRSGLVIEANSSLILHSDIWSMHSKVSNLINKFNLLIYYTVYSLYIGINTCTSVYLSY